jgi:glycosyltransferase involved in cell wall biosynthesis
MRAQLEQLVRKLGMGDRITFHGHVADRAILEKLLHKADLFAMTSVSEGMPRAMIEAMAKGVPCVGTTAGGIGELLTPAQRVPVGDWRALGKLIAAVATNPQMLTAFAAHGHTMALNFVDTELSQRRQRLLKILADAATSECPLPQ